MMPSFRELPGNFPSRKLPPHILGNLPWFWDSVQEEPSNKISKIAVNIKLHFICCLFHIHNSIRTEHFQKHCYFCSNQTSNFQHMPLDSSSKWTTLSSSTTTMFSVWPSLRLRSSSSSSLQTCCRWSVHITSLLYVHIIPTIYQHFCSI